MKYDFDSYLFYESTPRNTFNIKLKVNMKETVDGKVLETSAVKAFHRFPYYRRKLRIDETGAHILEPSNEELVVKPEGPERIVLGSEETNHLFFCITWEDKTIYFNAAHSFCGGCGVMFWIKATLWQYLTDLYHVEINSDGIITPLTPTLPGETDLPDIALALEEEGLPVENFGNSYFPVEDYRRAAKDALYIPIVIGQKEMLRYARSNDGSPNSILSAMMFKAMARVLKDKELPFLSAKIAANYREDVGCPNTYRDLVRLLRVKYTSDMADWPIEKLSTMTRGRMFLQMQPEISWEAYRKLLKFRDGIDAAQSHEEKVKYAGEHSIFRKAPMDTYTISYAGNSSWGGVADYVDSVFTITDGHLMIEVNALPGKICVCFQQVFEDDKYLKAFLQVLEEEGVPYELEKMDSKKLPGVKLGNI